MAKSRTKPAAAPRPTDKAQPIPRSRWQGPLLVGVCFALGYGITQRMLALQLPAFVQLGQGFELRPFPGTGLQSLRLKFGAEAEQIRGDLDLQQLQQTPPAGAALGEAKPDAPGTTEPAPQSEAKSANLDAADGQAPPAPVLPPPTPTQSPTPAPSPAPKL